MEEKSIVECAFKSFVVGEIVIDNKVLGIMALENKKKIDRFEHT